MELKNETECINIQTKKTSDDNEHEFPSKCCGFGCKEKEVDSSPILEFTSLKQAYECLREWQKRLFLDDWNIKLELTAQEDMPDSEAMGCNQHFPISKACKIYIKIPHKTDEGVLEKPCHELFLIHELLHCKPTLFHFAENKSEISACYLEGMEHMMLEQMAKSLLMARYNLDFDWFKNFKDK